MLGITDTKLENHDLGFYARFFESNWWKTMRLLTAWRIKKNIEKTVRQSKVSIFELIASSRVGDVFFVFDELAWPRCRFGFVFVLLCLNKYCMPAYSLW